MTANHGTNLYGTRAVLEEYDPYIGNGDVSAWVMLARLGSSVENSRWAQIGWLKKKNPFPTPGTVRYTLTQYHEQTPQGLGMRTHLAPGQPVNGYTFYEARIEGGMFRFFANNVLVSQGPVTWLPTHAQHAGEIHGLSNQMPGGYADHMAFVVRAVAYGYGGPWVDMGGSAFASYSYYHGSWSGGPTAVEIWDRQCAY